MQASILCGYKIILLRLQNYFYTWNLIEDYYFEEAEKNIHILFAGLLEQYLFRFSPW